MTRKTLLFALLPLAASFGPALHPATALPTETLSAPFHCQVPCGIYGDRMRIDMLMEDADTIAKGMRTITELEEAGGPSNQLVRWIMTKDAHAQSIQETIASYWLAQRIKAPAEDSGEARDKYHRQLALLHGITVASMKCKQTTDAAHVETLRRLALEFSGTYFSKEDLDHIREHHGKEERGADHK